MKDCRFRQFQLVSLWGICFCIGFGWLISTQKTALAQDLDTFARQARSAISASQRAMFSRKFEEAQEQLVKAADLIEQVKAADPNHSQLSTLENQFRKQQKDLKKRMPKEEAAKPMPEPKSSSGSDADQDLKTLARKAGNAISASQRAMMNRKFEDAQIELDKATELIAAIKAVDANFSQLKGLEGRYERQKADLEKRLPKEKSSTSSASTTQPASADSGTAKLPSNVTYYLKQVDRALAKQERIFEKEDFGGDPEYYIQSLEGTIHQANQTMLRIFETYGDQFDHEHPDVKARQTQIAEFQAKTEELTAKLTAQQAQAAEAEAGKKAQSEEWLQEIKPYITHGAPGSYDEDKYLIGAGTANVDELVARKKVYGGARAFFDEYQQVKFPNGKTQDLEMAEEKLARELKGFEEGYQESIDRFAAEAEEQLEYTEQWLTAQEATAKAGGDDKPMLLSQFMLQQIQRPLFALEASTGGEDSRLQGFNGRLAVIEERGANLRRLGIERTVMMPDAFGGQESDELKTKAAEFLHEEYADAEVLRTTIISKDWTEDRRWEYTDTTKSALRYRITRSVTAQIAGKIGNDVFLYTLDISKDQQSDDSWGALYGHVMFIEPMLEENVKK